MKHVDQRQIEDLNQRIAVLNKLIAVHPYSTLTLEVKRKKLQDALAILKKG